MHVLRVPRVVRDGEVAITNGHLALPKGQGEVAQLVQQTAQGLQGEREQGLTMLKPSWAPAGARPAPAPCEGPGTGTAAGEDEHARLSLVRL